MKRSKNNKIYTVEALSADDRKIIGSTKTIQAAGPLEAARLAFGATVASSGEHAELCGAVWELQDNLQPVRTEIFRPNGVVRQPLKRRRRPAMARGSTREETVALLKIVAVCVLAVATCSYIVLRSAAPA